MKLHKARIWCETCQKHFSGEAMSNAEDAEDLARIDHRMDKGHFAYGDATITETDSETEDAKRTKAPDVPQERRDAESERRSFKPERRPEARRRA